jgi:hypothetical protein
VAPRAGVDRGAGVTHDVAPADIPDRDPSMFFRLLTWAYARHVVSLRFDPATGCVEAQASGRIEYVTCTVRVVVP